MNCRFSNSNSKLINHSFYDILNIQVPARGGKCINGGIVPNTAFIFRVFLATPQTLSYQCIFSSFYLALNLKLPGCE